MSKNVKAALSLKQFILRQEVLKLYKDVFKTLRNVRDINDKIYLRDWARQDFRSNKNQTDEVTIKNLLVNGNKSLNELKTSLDLSGNSEGASKTIK